MEVGPLISLPRNGVPDEQRKRKRGGGRRPRHTVAERLLSVLCFLRTGLLRGVLSLHFQYGSGGGTMCKEIEHVLCALYEVLLNNDDPADNAVRWFTREVF